MIPVLARSKARVYGLSLAGNPASGIDVFLVNVVRCQVEVSALGRSLVQSSPAECRVSEYDCEALIIRRHWPTRGCRAMKKSALLRISTGK